MTKDSAPGGDASPSTDGGAQTVAGRVTGAEEAAATVRAYIGYEDDPAYEPSDEAIRLGVAAHRALDVLVAAAQRADRLAQHLHDLDQPVPKDGMTYAELLVAAARADRLEAAIRRAVDAGVGRGAAEILLAALADDGGAG